MSEYLKNIASNVRGAAEYVEDHESIEGEAVLIPTARDNMLVVSVEIPALRVDVIGKNSEFLGVVFLDASSRQAVESLNNLKELL